MLEGRFTGAKIAVHMHHVAYPPLNIKKNISPFFASKIADCGYIGRKLFAPVQDHHHLTNWSPQVRVSERQQQLLHKNKIFQDNI